MIDLSQNLNLKQTQELRLNQKQIQALKILQLHTLELNNIIEQELEQNPILELEETKKESKTSIEETKNITDEIEEKIDYDFRDRIEEDGYLPIPKYQNENEDVSFEKFVKRAESLSEYLLKQLRFVLNDEIDLKIGEFLIGNIDETGFLKISVEDISRYLDVDINRVEKVLKILQDIAPAGVGARDIRECLLLQYKDKNINNDIVFTILDKYLELLGKNKLMDIANKMGVDIEEIKKAVEIIRRELSPGPAIDEFIKNENLYIPKPDVIVIEEDGEYRVELNESIIPKLKKNNYYLKLLKNPQNLNKNTLKYLKEKAKAADEFLNSLNKRKKTILLIAELIVKKQKGFFKYGIRRLKPFTIREVAEELSLHESTISRAVNGKYMATPRGMFEFRFFFTSSYNKGYSNNNEGESRESVKDIIREFIENEDKKRPLSDQKITDMLKKRGINIARRTVAKYREELGILSASKRKIF